MNRFVFHQTWTEDIQSMLEILQLIYDFLANNNTVNSSVFTFPFGLVVEVNLASQMASALCFSLSHEYRRAGSIPVKFWSLWALMSSIQSRLYIPKFKTETLLSALSITIIFYKVSIYSNNSSLSTLF